MEQEPTATEQQKDHDILIEIRTELRLLTSSLSNAGIPAICAKETQRIISLESRVKQLEGQRNWIVGLVIAFVVAALMGLIIIKGGTREKTTATDADWHHYAALPQSEKRHGWPAARIDCPPLDRGRLAGSLGLDAAEAFQGFCQLPHHAH